MKKYLSLYNIFFAGVLIALALPLLSLPPLFSPPDWGKTLVFRILLSIEIVIAAAIALFHAGSLRPMRWKQKEGVGFLMLLGILGLFLAATIFSFDRTFSIWGSPFRSGGVVNFASYIIFAILAFLILRPQDWKRAWNFAITAAALVSMAAIFQWQGLFSGIFIETGLRPTSSLGNPILLAMYLLFFVFITLCFAFKERITWRKCLYAFLACLFLFIIFLAQTRSVYLGLAVAFSYFILFFPFLHSGRAKMLKGAFLALCMGVLGFVYFVNVNQGPALPEFILENRTLFGLARRANMDLFLEDPRFSSWQVTWKSILERPLLGYGPENFEIAFDRSYDPKLPGIQLIQETPNSWWDKAHNSFFDVAAQAGIPAALLYFALFAVLFLQLQEIKKKSPEQTLLIHGIQATFIGYLTANFFSFDAFSTFLISFFLVAYSLFLIHSADENGKKQQETPPIHGLAGQKSITQKWIALSGLALFLAWLSWSYAVLPLQINVGLNVGVISAKNKQCEEGFKLLDKAVAESKGTFVSAYTRLKYFDTLKICNDQGAMSNLETAQKGYDALKEASIAWPNHTRTWIFLGQLANIIVEQQGKSGALSVDQRAEGIAQAHSYFEKAKQLSPGHLEVYIDWIKTFLLAQDYPGAAAKAQECIDLNPDTGQCWFLKGVVEEFAGNSKQRSQYIKIAEVKGFHPERSMASLTILAQAFLTSQDLGSMANTYEKMVALQPDNYQLRASLAFTYYQLREFDKAREQALKVLETNPAAKDEVNAFLELLP